MRSLLSRAVLIAACSSIFLPSSARATDLMCDPSYQDCRTVLLNYINRETLAIDLAMLFMEDHGLADAIIARHNAGVRVRLLVEPRRNSTTPENEVVLAKLKAAGIPMRAKNGGGVLHWKFMLFDAQNVVQFSAANYSDFYFRPTVPYSNYTDEGIYFTSQGSIVDSFRRKFDDAWVDPSAFYDYGNVTSLARRYPLYGIDPELSFVPFEDFASRSVPLYDNEQQKIDVIMYKITEPRHAEAIIRAVQRGVPVRLITEGERYRNPANIFQAYFIDRLYMAGVQIRDRAHEGFLHQKSTLLYGQGLTVFGSANWTEESNTRQYEHNYFTSKVWFFDWFRQNFERKWNNSTGAIETAPFAPQPPTSPSYVAPANGATGVATSGAVLQWNPGPWSWYADVYFGTTANPPLYRANVAVGPSETNSFALPALTAGTTYYWKIVSKTAANLGAAGAVQSFTAGTATAPPPPPPAPSLPSPWQSQDIGAVGPAGSAGATEGTFTVRGGGADVWGTADAFHFAWQRVTGDVDVIARVASVEYVHAWVKAGVMIRESLTPGSAHAFMLVSPAKGRPFQRRVANGGLSTSTGSGGAAPAWVKLERRGNAITASVSEDGGSWTIVASDSFAMPAEVHVGLAVSSHDTTRLATATFDNVLVRPVASAPPPPPPPPPPPALPDPWHSQDVGAVGPAGTASASNGTFTVKGAGADVWGTADAFHYAWQQVTGDVDVVARVASVEYVQAWVKAGVMIRESLSADSPHGFMLVSAGKGYAFQRRLATAGLSTHSSGGAGAAPAWVKLERRASTITAFVSSDGATWTPVGSDTFTMGATVYVGLAVSSHDATRLATATFDNVAVTAPTTAPPPPPPPADLKEIVLHAADAAVIAGNWRLESDATAASGIRAWNPNLGGAKVVTAVAAPAHYIELTFTAEAGRAYRLWIRGKAEGDLYNNDSAHVQFSGAVDANGTPIYRIGTTASAEYNLEACSGCGVAGWGWEDNGWGQGVLGPVIYFATTGTQRIRLQTREDGLSVDQIVLSAERFLNVAPGPGKYDTTILNATAK